MAENVLIAGGSGLLGQAISKELIVRGYGVRLLGRSKKKENNTETFVWDPALGILDEAAFDKVDFIINLAGANVGEGRWTKKRKKELLESRTTSTQLLVNAISRQNRPIKKFIQASAIGYYGFSDQDVEYSEKDDHGKDFLAMLCQAWENKTELLQKTHTPLLIFRIGVVFSNQGGALKAMAQPIKMFAGSALGSGKQYVPWIHVDDLVAIFLKGIEDQTYTGVYNAVAPNPISNKLLTKAIAEILHRPIWPIGVPTFILNILLGEQAQIVTKGNRISAEKIKNLGYQFKYPSIAEALKNLLIAQKKM